MKKIIWSIEKAAMLRNDTSRGNVGFEDCVIAIEEGRVLADIANPSKQYPHQRMLEIDNYAYVVPYVETEDEFFLKTVFPSRKHTTIYLKK